MKNPRRFSTIQNLLFKRGHIERSRGSDEDNKKYCSKEQNFWEYGEIKSQTNIKDSEIIRDMIKDNCSVIDIIERYPGHFMRYYRGIEQMIKYLQKPESRNWKTEVYYYWGEPGTGKTKAAHEESNATGERTYWKNRTKWWDGYDGQENIIIDDFYGWIAYDELLRLLDRYPMQVEIKGGFKEMTAKRIWITSNIPIEDLYKHSHFFPEAIRRRCTVIKHFNKF